jgi:hypothetical protein
MSTKPERTLATAQDVLEYLWVLLCKKRYYRIENDFHLGYNQALTDVCWTLMYATPCSCGECDGQTLSTVQEILDHLFYEIQYMRKNLPPENDLGRGYEEAKNAIMYELWLVSPESVKSGYVLRKLPEGSAEGAEVIDLADGRTIEIKAPLVTKDNEDHLGSQGDVRASGQSLATAGLEATS